MHKKIAPHSHARALLRVVCVRADQMRTELVKQGILEVVVQVYKDIEDPDVKQEAIP